MSDELEIPALLNRYARAVDTKDSALYRSVFTDDAHIDYSSAGAIAGTLDEVADWLSQGFAAIPMTSNYITNIESQVDGDKVRVRAMFYNPMKLPGMPNSVTAEAITTTNWCEHPTAGAAAASAKKLCGSSIIRSPKPTFRRIDRESPAETPISA